MSTHLPDSAEDILNHPSFILPEKLLRLINAYGDACRKYAEGSAFLPFKEEKEMFRAEKELKEWIAIEFYNYKPNPPVVGDESESRLVPNRQSPNP